MTLLERYITAFQPNTRDVAQFEIAIDEDNAPVHISLRPDEDVIVINSKIENNWGEEFRINYRLRKIKSALPIIVDVLDDHAIIRIQSAGVALRFHEQHLLDRTKWFAQSYMQWSTHPLDIALLADSPTRSRTIGKWPALVEINNRTLWLPSGAPSEQVAALIRAAAQGGHNSDLVSFLGSHSFPADLQVLDLHRDGGYSALLHASLNPKATVFHLEDNPQAAALPVGLAKRSGISNFKIIRRNELERWLKTLNGRFDLLVQGDQVVGQFETLLAALPPAQRARTHLFSVEQTVVPANTVFRLCGSGATNIRIRSSEWQLNHRPTPGMRSPGLDVVVAAYNVKDYIVDCVSSVLCAGRDDVRVIVVNDGSTDGTENVVAKTFKGDPRVIIATKPNGGCASARNYGRLLSERAHVTFVDGDDMVSPGFFADLYDLALYTGAEIVQGGFDFYDAARAEPLYPSYEEELFGQRERTDFAGKGVFELATSEIIKGQPAIWRRVYRRDFLDARNIWFPENVRAYDDYLFHILSLTSTYSVWMMPEQKYYYRQHPAQDIKAGDERHFYMLHMFRALLSRSIDEGWPNFLPYVESIMDSINWSASKLRPDLVDSFLIAAARFCVAVKKVYGREMMSPRLLGRVGHPDFMFHYEREVAAMSHLNGGTHWAYTSGAIEHPDILRMRQSLLQSQ